MIDKTQQCYPLARIGFSLAFCMLLSLVHAKEADTEQIPVPTSQEEAIKQRELAERIRNEAEAQYKIAQEECHRKFLVNDCLEDAKERRMQEVIYARELEAPAIVFQREARRAEAQEKRAQRESNLQRKEVEDKKQSEEFRAEEAKKTAERERKLEDKARKAEEHHKKRLQENARRQKKQAERAERDADIAAKKAQRESEERSE